MLSISEYEKKLNRAVGQESQIHSDLKTAQNHLKSLQSKLPILEKAQAYIQTKAQETQSQLSIRVEDIVQMAIDTCFADGGYQFKLAFDMKRGRTEAEMKLLKDGWEADPMDSNGGGLVDVESFGLRISAWTLKPTADVIILDEPFKFLSNDLKPLAGEIIQELSKRLGLQMIIVTHDTSIIEESDQLSNVALRKGVSRVKTSTPQ
jgi:DNA repair exonuclease SbcCD ATPase subunit